MSNDYATFAVNFFDGDVPGVDVPVNKERCRACKILGTPTRRDEELVMQHDGNPTDHLICAGRNTSTSRSSRAGCANST